MRTCGLAGWALSLTLLSVTSGFAEVAPDRVLQGVLQRADHETYRELAFELPPGVKQLQVVFSYDRSEATVIDLGLRDPDRFRGWSGGNKLTFTVGETQATPSYLAGLLPPGTWHLLLGIPNIRDGVSTAYRAEIYFEVSDVDATAATDSAAAESAVTALDEAGWYRGDFHAHSGHSDGTCAEQSGARMPCPVIHTVEAAAARGLDFVSLTEHNTGSHRQEMVDVRDSFERMLLLPGIELTTFSGHANLFSYTQFFDFPAAAQNLPRTFADVRAAGGLVSINHPGLPSDERCLGCGWTATVDAGSIDAVEIVNGGVLRATGDRGDSARAGVQFWETLLNSGHRVTGIGGSDNHDPLLAESEASAIGRPTTVVFAQSLSELGVLDGVRSGRVFIDVEGTRDRRIDLTAVVATHRTEMGGSLCVPEGEAIDLEVEAVTVAGDRILLIQEGREIRTEPAVDASGRTRVRHQLRSPGVHSWIRAESRGEDGAIRLLSNPIYFNCRQESANR